MIFMFGFNFDNIVSTRATVITLVFITCYHTTVALFIFENFFCLPVKKIIPCVPFCFKLLYFYDFQTCKYHLNYCSPITVFSCHMMFLTACGVFGMWDIQDVGCSGCGMSGMWNVADVRYSGCGMFRMWRVWDVGYLGCGMLGMWDIQGVRCSGCEMFGMWDVWDVQCSRYVMFRIWDVRNVGSLGCEMFWIWDVQNMECSKCLMFGMLNVDVGYLWGCGMLVCQMPSFIAVRGRPRTNMWVQQVSVWTNVGHMVGRQGKILILDELKQS